MIRNLKSRTSLKKLCLRLPILGPMVAHRDALIAENIELARQISRPAPRANTLSGIVNPAHYSNAEWLALHHELSNYSIDKHCFQNCSGEIYRKGWEWTQCLYGLRELQMLKPEYRALGVGVGRESVIYYLADHIAHVMATDLYGAQSWSSQGGREADLALLEASKAYCPVSVNFSKITFENQDGTHLTYANDSFDFAWSLSSIEHFGGHAAATKAMQEMARVVRPGGVVAVATEMLLLEEYSHPEYFTQSEIMAELLNPCPELEIIGHIDFDALPSTFLVDQIVIPAGADRRRRHVVLNDGNVQWTSILMFFRVRETSAPLDRPQTAR
jgi:SAM-dependent methyltransferase